MKRHAAYLISLYITAIFYIIQNIYSDERILTINLPKNVMVFDVKSMIRVIYHSVSF